MPPEPLHFSYLLRQNGAAWQIIVVYLNGAISELATPRSESGSILRGQGIDGLIVTLNAEADTLAAHPS
jgi:phospholipid transport system substrate-binding protein